MPDPELEYSLKTLSLIQIARTRFVEINQTRGLTEADKKQLKEFYLQNFVAPRARKLLEKYFPEDFPTSEGSGTPRRASSP